MIELVRVKQEDEAILQNVIQFYIYEFTVFRISSLSNLDFLHPLI